MSKSLEDIINLTTGSNGLGYIPIPEQEALIQQPNNSLLLERMRETTQELIDSRPKPNNPVTVDALAAAAPALAQAITGDTAVSQETVQAFGNIVNNSSGYNPAAGFYGELLGTRDRQLSESAIQQQVGDAITGAVTANREAEALDYERQTQAAAAQNEITRMEITQNDAAFSQQLKIRDSVRADYATNLAMSQEERAQEQLRLNAIIEQRQQERLALDEKKGNADIAYKVQQIDESKARIAEMKEKGQVQQAAQAEIDSRRDMVENISTVLERNTLDLVKSNPGLQSKQMEYIALSQANRMFGSRKEFATSLARMATLEKAMTPEELGSIESILGGNFQPTAGLTNTTGAIEQPTQESPQVAQPVAPVNPVEELVAPAAPTGYDLVDAGRTPRLGGFVRNTETGESTFGYYPTYQD